MADSKEEQAYDSDDERWKESKVEMDERKLAQMIKSYGYGLARKDATESELLDNIRRLDSILIMFKEAPPRSKIFIDEISNPLYLCTLLQSLRGILQSSGGDETLKQGALGLCSTLLNAYEWKFIESDPAFLGLIAQLAQVELRIILNGSQNWKSIRGTLLSLCVLIETAIMMGNDESVTGIPDASLVCVMKAAKESATLALQFAAIKLKAKKIDVSSDVTIPLQRMCCAFLAEGGSEILKDKELLRDGLKGFILITTSCTSAELRETGREQLLAVFDQIDDKEIVNELRKFTAEKADSKSEADSKKAGKVDSPDQEQENQLRLLLKDIDRILIQK